MNKETFIAYCKNININITKELLNKFELYKDLIQEWNLKFNLTTIIKDDDIYLKHFYDSLYLSKEIDLNNKNICDFGTGAGFPGMVLSIIFSSSHFTLLESNNKKVLFLNEVKKKLKLENVTIINQRAEIYGKENREVFDIITCRAVSNLSIILELSASMLKVNGYFVPMKSNIEDELIKSNNIQKELGYSLIKKQEYLLPIENSNRTILIYKKVKQTDKKYPRNYNLIKKHSV